MPATRHGIAPEQASEDQASAIQKMVLLLSDPMPRMKGTSFWTCLCSAHVTVHNTVSCYYARHDTHNRSPLRQAPPNATSSPAVAASMTLTWEQFVRLGSDPVTGAIRDAPPSRNDSRSSELSLRMWSDQVRASTCAICCRAGAIAFIGSHRRAFADRTYASLLRSLLQAHHRVVTRHRGAECWQPASECSVPSRRPHRRILSHVSETRCKVPEARAIPQAAIKILQVGSW